MKAMFEGRIYCDESTAKRNREVAVSIRALRMMQAHYNNKYYSFLHHCSDAEKAEWVERAERLTPQIYVLDGTL